MKIAITGAAGLLGRGLAQVFSENHEVIALTRANADITDAEAMHRVLREASPELIVHTAGMPDIDECELNPEKAFQVNAEATKSLVEIAREMEVPLAHISTDAVFDGKSERPYVEGDPMNPISVYGRTKALAEEHVRAHSKHWIFRVSVLFGPGKANFVNKGLCKAMGKEPYVVASDQLGSATYTIDAGATMLRVFSSGKYGTYHLCNQGACTRYELARKAVELAGMDPATVVGKPMSEMQRPGPRLKYAVMEMRGLREAGIPLPRTWEDALKAYAATMKSK